MRWMAKQLRSENRHTMAHRLEEWNGLGGAILTTDTNCSKFSRSITVNGTCAEFYLVRNQMSFIHISFRTTSKVAKLENH